MTLTVPIDVLRIAVQDMLKSDPNIEPFVSRVPRAKGVRLKRYLAHGTRPIGQEHTLKTGQNLWVRQQDVRLARLCDIQHTIKPGTELADNDSANSNLFTVPQFRGADLVRFRAVNVADAARIIQEVLF